MENKDLDKLFRNSFENAEVQPDDKVWQHIVAKLDEQTENKATTEHVERKFLWWHYAAAASVLLALGVTFWTVRTADEDRKMGQEMVVQQPSEEVEKSPIEGRTSETVKDVDSNVPLSAVPAQDNIVVTVAKQREQAVPPPTEPTLIVRTLDTEGIESSLPTQLGSLVTTKEIKKLPTYRVTEIEDIKPLIEPEEEMESMYATIPSKESSKSTVVTSILNTLSENIEFSSSRDIRFRADEEGSLRVDIINSLVKNRNKKRR